MAKEWNAVYDRHKILVTANDIGARLYIDGELMDATNDFWASGVEPTLVGVIDENVLEVFARPDAAEIWISGVRIDGDFKLAATA